MARHLYRQTHRRHYTAAIKHGQCCTPLPTLSRAKSDPLTCLVAAVDVAEESEERARVLAPAGRLLDLAVAHPLGRRVRALLVPLGQVAVRQDSFIFLFFSLYFCLFLGVTFNVDFCI